jgi:predicted alpha/beta hydrolase
VAFVELTAKDGYKLGATLFRPAATNGRTVFIMAATGVPQQYYAKFAAFLAEGGFTVLTFDYRGIGRSLHSSIRSVNAGMRDWALLDSAAACDFLDQHYPGEKLMAIGHSFGGQAFGLLPRPERIAAAVTIGSQSGYWKHWPPLGRAWMWPATHLALPLVPRLLGYFPGARLGFGENLPKNVTIEWARWCRHPRYLVGALGVEREYARVAAPIRLYAISDDAFAPRRAVEALAALYDNATSQIRSVEPKDVGADRIGHFGFFRERFRDSLWAETRGWLEAQ